MIVQQYSDTTYRAYRLIIHDHFVRSYKLFYALHNCINQQPAVAIVAADTSELRTILTRILDSNQRVLSIDLLLKPQTYPMLRELHGRTIAYICLDLMGKSPSVMITTT